MMKRTLTLVRQYKTSAKFQSSPPSQATDTQIIYNQQTMNGTKIYLFNCQFSEGRAGGGGGENESGQVV